MKVGFFHQGPGGTLYTRLACVLMASVRQSMPGVPIVHLTDQDTAGIRGADEVLRVPNGPMALTILEAYAGCGVGDWLLLDSDVMVQADVQHVFEENKTFDVAVATREGTLRPKEVGTKFMETMPFNKGAVFSRSPAFWRAAAEWLKTQPEKLQMWMGDQRAMNEVIATDRFNVRVLPAAYNYPPFTKGDVADKAVLHYKGSRKAWMEARA